VIEKILVINFGGLEDMIYSTPIFKEIKKNIPDCYLSLLTQPNYSEVFINNSNIDELILFDKIGYRMKDVLKFYLKLRKRDIDLVIDLSKSGRGAFISYMTGAPERVGFKYKGYELFAYNIRVKRDNTKYVVESLFDVLRALGMKVEDLSLKLYPREKDWSVVRDFLIDKKIDWTKPIIALNPNTSVKIREWTSQGFAEVGNTLIKKYAANIIIIQAPHQKQLVSAITKRMETSPIIAPEFTIKQLALLISKISLLITTDSGIKSIGVAMNVPTITLFGPTNYLSSTPPYGQHLVVKKDIHCSPCGKLKCKKAECMRSITPQDVLTKVEEILKICPKE